MKDFRITPLAKVLLLLLAPVETEVTLVNIITAFIMAPKRRTGGSSMTMSALAKHLQIVNVRRRKLEV